MRPRFAMIALAALVSTAAAIAPVPTATAGPCELGAVCVNSEDCRLGAVCVNSEDCRLGAVCVGSHDCYAGAVCVNDHDCRLGAVCIGTLKKYALVALGSVQGVHFEGDYARTCTSTALLGLSYDTGAWSYSQHFAATPGQEGCTPELFSLHRSYSSEDSQLLVDGDSWTITRESPTPNGPTYEFTRISFVSGGALFEQSASGFDGRPTWHATGFLASPQAL